MSTFVLIPGAGGAAWYWSLVVPELRRRGHDAIAVDIREDDPSLGLPEYADIVRAAITGHSLADGLVLVAQSMGAFTAPVVAKDVPVSRIVLLNPMIPVPGETPGEWWDATGQDEARIRNDEQAGRSTEFGIESHFLHDVPPEVAAAGADTNRGPSDTPFGQPCEFERWPDVPIHVLLGEGDRFFPLEFARGVAKQRLGVDADVISGGHLVALSNPTELADRLVAYAA